MPLGSLVVEHGRRDMGRSLGDVPKARREGRTVAGRLSTDRLGGPESVGRIEFMPTSPVVIRPREDPARGPARVDG